MLASEKALVLLEKRIEACSRRGYLPAELLDLVAKVYRIQLEAREKAIVHIGAITDDAAHILGAPLVVREKFPFDRDQAKALFDVIAATVAEVSPQLASAITFIKENIKSGAIDLDAAMQAHLNSDEAYFSQWAPETAPRILPMLIQACMTPSVEKAAETLTTTKPLDSSWSHGHCPVCGSFPLISDLREKEGFRFNTCSFCHSEYRSGRLECPFCLEKDTAKLNYYDIPEEPGFRINSCTTCQMYIKITDFRAMDRASLPLVDDLESLPLDMLAREKKLKRPTLSAWGF